MAAFVGMGISNAIVNINACEIPIMDWYSLFIKRFQSRNKNTKFQKEHL